MMAAGVASSRCIVVAELAVFAALCLLSATAFAASVINAYLLLDRWLTACTPAVCKCANGVVDCVMLQTCDRMSIPMHQVDAHNVVPVWAASEKKETGARTIRKKIHTKLPTYLEVCTMGTALMNCKPLYMHQSFYLCHL